jgi:DNA primase
MNKQEFEEVKKHVDIINVAYHLCLPIVDNTKVEVKATCPFCGYRKSSKQNTLSLNTNNNKYHCFSCGAGGYSIRTIC